MDSKLTRKIHKALESRRPSGHATQQPEILAAIKAVAIDTGTNDQEIIYRAIRLYLTAYLHTHTQSWFDPSSTSE